jgi:hypothetical protein
MLSGIALVAALAAGTPFVSVGSFRYTGTLEGQPAGSSSLNVTRDGDSTKIEESASGSLAGNTFTGKASLVLGADLAPIRYAGDYQIGAQHASAMAALTATSATVVGSLGGSAPQTLALGRDSSHFVVIEPGLLAGLFALPAQMEAWKDPTVQVIAPASGQARSIAPDTKASPPPRPASVPATDASLSFTAGPAFTIWYDPATFVPDEIDVPSQNAVVTRVRE